MNKIKKIKNLFITSFVLFFLTEHSYKLINGYKYANNICKHHTNSSCHDENIVAHRGFSGLYLDNSIESIEAALNSNCVDMIEIDVRLTQNNKIVLHHDSIVNYEDTLINLEDLSLETIDDEDINYIVKPYSFYNIEEFMYDDNLFLYNRFFNKTIVFNEEKLIFLSDIIKKYSFSKPLIIDVKVNKLNIEYMNELNRILEKHQDNIFIQSDNFNFLNEMIELYPNYNYLYIVNSYNDLKNKNNKFKGYTIRYGLLNKINIEKDKIYLIYTINSNLKYYNLLKNKNYRNNMYIITDHPDYICALSENKILRK